MSEDRSGYNTDRIEWVLGLQGPQPPADEVTVNGVRYIRADRCATCHRTCRYCAHWHFPSLDYFNGQTTSGRCDVRPDCFTDPTWDCADWERKG